MSYHHWPHHRCVSPNQKCGFCVYVNVDVQVTSLQEPHSHWTPDLESLTRPLSFSKTIPFRPPTLLPYECTTVPYRGVLSRKVLSLSVVGTSTDLRPLSCRFVFMLHLTPCQTRNLPYPNRTWGGRGVEILVLLVSGLLRVVEGVVGLL